ncbi:MAG: hypothetical protein Phog2KO_23910 [Phototrophicaceae bacterium]
MNEFVDEMFASMTTELDADAVQDFIGAEFPETAENVYIVGESALDTFVAARFDIAIDDLQPYLNEIGISEEFVQGELPFLTTSLPIFGTPDWWQVSEAETMDYSGLSEFVSPNHYNILIINLDDETVRIYMTAHNT